jgi:hypothetical protein
MPKTYEPISTTTLVATSASVTFSSIPQTYTDLVIVINGQASSGGSRNSLLNFNSDTATNYSATLIYGNGTSALSSRGSNISYAGGCVFSSSVNSTVIYNIMNYSNTTTFKTILGRGNVSNDVVDLRVALWRSTAAITSIAIALDSSITFASGCIFTLYGIKAA